MYATGNAPFTRQSTHLHLDAVLLSDQGNRTDVHQSRDSDLPGAVTQGVSPAYIGREEAHSARITPDCRLIWPLIDLRIPKYGTDTRIREFFYGRSICMALSHHLKIYNRRSRHWVQ